MEKWKEANANKEKNEPQIPKVPERFWEDVDWAEEHFSHLSEKYTDMWVAIVDGEVVSFGKNGGIVEEEARAKTGKKHIYMIFAESGMNVW